MAEIDVNTSEHRHSEERVRRTTVVRVIRLMFSLATFLYHYAIICDEFTFKTFGSKQKNGYYYLLLKNLSKSKLILQIQFFLFQRVTYLVRMLD